MASFFQPGSLNPTFDDCSNSRFKVYCNSILPENQRFVHTFQLVNISLALSSFLVPVLFYFTYYIITFLLKDGLKSLWTSKEKIDKTDGSRDDSRPALHMFRSNKSFTFLSELDVQSSNGSYREYDLVVLPLYMGGSVRGEPGDSHSSICTVEHVASKMSLANIDIDAFGPDALEDSHIEETIDFLLNIHLRNELAGFALQYSIPKKPGQVNYLLERLYSLNIPVLLSCQHDSEALDSISLTHASGLIIENACILPNGERRDYFKAKRLRQIVARVGTEREQRADFFLGFFDKWDRKPHPSVVRRAAKLAEHFGAVIEHGPKDTSVLLKVTNSCATQTLSGFEYLRRPEIIELQKSWTSEARKVWIPNGSSDSKIAQLPLEDLDTLITRASELLKHNQLAPELELIRTQTVKLYSSPEYVHRAPPRASFWDSSHDGKKLSALGCFPVTSEPRAQHYRAVVETQVHLRKLNMLHAVEGNEEEILLKTWSTLAKREKCDRAVHDLVSLAKSRQVRIYKGLDTGFGLADGDAHFWGVSHERNEAQERCVDIYISQKAPNDAAAIFHTWLAHQGTPREQRFEQELELELADRPNGGSSVPLSIRTAIERATYAEILGLVQKLRVSRLNHPIGDGIKSLCHSILINETSKASWKQTCAQRVLDGSSSIKDILRMRLEHYVRQGATELPSLDNLVTLHDLTNEAVEDALFFGERKTLRSLTSVLLSAYDPSNPSNDCGYVDINAELFALIFFSVLRRAAFEDVYMESTDRCPLFASQPDQAAVFCELWALGSQCEVYFGLLPRDLGNIVYNKYRTFLESSPPTSEDRNGNEIMTMYSKTDATPAPKDSNDSASTSEKLTRHETVQLWRKRLAEAGAMSIFCVPAIVDIILLTFVGRGLFMTAFMDPEHLEAAGYALLLSLLLTAGVTGWVGSTGNYYAAHYAYENMVYFHVQRLSGGFILTLVVGFAGLILFSLRFSVATGFVFVAFLVCITTYFNLLGVMSAMHQHESPIRSGRNILLKVMPILLISPIVSTFVNGYDMVIYLPVMYTFLFVTLYRFRRLCHEWISWMDRIPKFTHNDIVKWYQAQEVPEFRDDEEKGEKKDEAAMAQEAFTIALVSHQRRTREARVSGVLADPLVSRVAEGMPYIDWLLKKTMPTGNRPDTFSTAWFTLIAESTNQQRQLSRGLKDHNPFIIFRLARFDIGQNLGLFLVALMDRWLMMVWSAGGPYPSIYTDPRSRYGLCLCIVYFCVGAMLLDSTLHEYWALKDNISKEKLRDLEHAQELAARAEAYRRVCIFKALTDIMAKLFVTFGMATLMLYVFVDTLETTLIYYMYVLGYTCAIVFQFNRCFTTNVNVHITIILSSAAIGFIAGCILHIVPATAQSLYTDVIAQNIASVCGAAGTSLWIWKDWTAASRSESTSSTRRDESSVLVQRRLGAEVCPPFKTPSTTTLKALSGSTVRHNDGNVTSDKVLELLHHSLETQHGVATDVPWSLELLQTTLEMWLSQSVVVKIASREEFVRASLSDVTSFSRKEDNVLQVTIGLIGEAEVASPAWHSFLMAVIGECLLYHVARSQLKASHAKAIQAEHLLHKTGVLSKRIDMELALGDVQHTTRLVLKTEAELMRHLCLDVNVNCEWERTPQVVREAIVHRISGDDVAVSPEMTQWALAGGVDLETSDFHINLTLQVFQKCQERLGQIPILPNQGLGVVPECPAELRPINIVGKPEPSGMLQGFWNVLLVIPLQFVKWVAIISSGGSNIERELAYCLGNAPLKDGAIRIILFIWNICRAMKNMWLYWVLIYHRPSLVGLMRIAQKGARRKIQNNSIIVEMPRKAITGFASINDNGTMTLRIYSGTLQEQLADDAPLSIDTYDDQVRLKVRENKNGSISTYEYDENIFSRWPLTKMVSEKDFCSVGYYDERGRVVRGTVKHQDIVFAFHFHYKSDMKDSCDVLRADFTLANSDSDNMLSVFWGTPVDPEDYSWVPSQKVGRIVRKVDSKIYTSIYEHLHRRDPIITTFLDDGDGLRTALVKAPEVFPQESIFLKYPKDVSFDYDDLLIYHETNQIRQMQQHAIRTRNVLSSLNPVSWIGFWNRRRYRRVPTWHIRTALWNNWLKSGKLDAVTACWIDELVLREERLLRKYWHARDRGRLDDARRALDENIHQIVSAIDIETDVSELCLLRLKTSDLYAMGLSNDATPITARPQDCFKDTEDRVSIIFNDIGCWPVAPGGVSNCRRDLVNGHSTIRNHVLAECANDYGVPRFQIEKNVQSLKLLPLWGIDGGTANHGVIDNLLESQVDEKIANTQVQRDIIDTFLPLLTEFVKGARTKHLSRADLIKYGNVILSMAKYYEYKDYSSTWTSLHLEEGWVAAWLKEYDDPNIASPSQCFEIERPSIPDFRDALGIFRAYFFIFAVQVPDECPRAFQSTHHGISSLFGLILKYRRGAHFSIWDHAILWRETCLNISPAQCELPVAVQSMLLAGVGLATRLAYFHADVISPCASLFNPMWEIEIGTDKGTVGNRNMFSRKIDPIVNGISNMESFTPVDKIRTYKPTVVMLSNVQVIKGVKVAAQAAEIIINRFGFTDYQLVIYGAKDRQPAYALEMEKFIVDNNLSDKVILAGFGDPKEVLKDAWLFMNSSISEGLPLAIGEAALAGVPIVATEVGATALVLTDPKNPEQQYGEVVPPNDPLALARAQISMLSMVGRWSQFTDEAGSQNSVPELPDDITPEDVDWLTERFYSKSEYRRTLGMISRQTVLHSFHGSRYLREHEQMYWIQWHQSGMRAEERLRALSHRRFKFGNPLPLRYTEDDANMAVENVKPGRKRSKSTALKEAEDTFAAGVKNGFSLSMLVTPV
ncbi:uncharacterized protein BKA55DRAFT_706140 [Fusarium redolens]|uniref:Glycosyl transferase n=1 Tax=Fusarium redolens TaxID=48865 RepID=A0A9P9GI89_FUSRE|nr:uncharacterized protein BKA55DRAFT_706140 [Fusarium redolens]KAH7239890.1 hypothetical protein BKA55DRAFT_706140 [Fusarium redolens]